MEIPSVKNIKNLKGKKVLLRGSLNVPMKNGRVADDFRLRSLLPTLEYLEKKGAKIILIGHIGRDPKETLKPVAEYFNKKLGKTVGFAPDLYASDLPERVNNLGNGQILMLENVRRYPEETAGDKKFAKHLASFGEVYVNEAFAASHRKHASITGVPQFLPGYAGLRFLEEVKHLTKAENPRHPFLFIIGGAKFETKVPLLKKFTKIADRVFVGGAIANDLWKAAGVETGKSLVGKDDPFAAALVKKANVLSPLDVVVESAGKSAVRNREEMKKADVIVDAGPKTIAELQEEVKKAKFILWNGPLGFYEKGYDKATKKLLKAIAESKAVSVIGGGDTVTLICKLKMEDIFTFVSSGGGAMLDFLEDGSLPGIEALQKSTSE
ncbi:MAG TPA: phosphoglycerate kinase [Candidatus Paceibacterota bacterium]|nr:phosphoglycerate kinase [Candidatus Paceibacterota bacterium]